MLGQVRRLTAAGGRRLDFTQPAGAPGWFDPESVCWRVHADFVPMPVGGIRALLLEALHPLALAAVCDHSNLRGDLRTCERTPAPAAADPGRFRLRCGDPENRLRRPCYARFSAPRALPEPPKVSLAAGQGIYSQVLSGRLGRTALFIAATTYGDTGMAAQVVTRVRAVHARAEWRRTVALITRTIRRLIAIGVPRGVTQRLPRFAASLRSMPAASRSASARSVFSQLKAVNWVDLLTSLPLSRCVQW